MSLHIKPVRAQGLPAELRRELVERRHALGWSQAELGKRTGLPQAHISGIESGKIVPRFNTLLDLIRIMDRDFVLVPRELLPAVQALLRTRRPKAEQGEQSLYASGNPDEEE